MQAYFVVMKVVFWFCKIENGRASFMNWYPTCSLIHVVLSGTHLCDRENWKNNWENSVPQCGVFIGLATCKTCTNSNQHVTYVTAFATLTSWPTWSRTTV
jgi:hypothetical protein